MLLEMYTLVHVAISLVGIASGLAVVVGMLSSQRLDRWTAVFLVTTIATSVTGFGFPVDRFLPSHGVGILSLLILAVAVYARYARQLDGIWRRAYVVGAVAALYLNVFVGVVQTFQRVPAIRALAPTQSEPPFVATQVVTLAVFIVVGIAAAVRFRPNPAPILRRANV
jgi:hypothetical protein